MNNDLISRKWLTDAIRNRKTYLSYEDAKDVIDLIDNAPTVTTEDKEEEAYSRGFEIGKKIGARAERTMTIAYLEGKTNEEDKIEQMFKNGEIEAIPYLGETAEEEK